MRFVYLLVASVTLSCSFLQAQTPCSGIPPTPVIAGTTYYGDTIVVVASGFGNTTGLSFQWEFTEPNLGVFGWIPIEQFFPGNGSDTVLVFPISGIDTAAYVRLTVTCQNGGGISHSDSILIGDSSYVQGCYAWYSFLQTGGSINFHFVGYPDDPQGTYSWQFGDGNTSTGQSPQHVFTASGTYTVCLTYTDINGNSCNYCNDVSAYQYAILTGTVYADANQNGQQDAGEIGIANQLVGTSTWGYGYTDSLGHYSISVPLGSYTLSYDAYGWNPSSWQVTNAGGNSITVNATDTLTYSGNDFGVYVNPNYHDLGVYAFCENPVPGFENWSYYEVYNNGANTETGVVTIDYDPNLEYVSSYPAPSSVNTTTHQLVYNLVVPAGYTYIEVTYQCPTTLALGTSVYDSVHVALTGGVDVDASNDAMSCQSMVVGSFDPNEKSVNPAGVGNNHAINPNHADELTYTVQFQNTGTAPAHFIVVKDTLDNAKLDLTSLRLLHYTHDCHIDLVGNVLTAYFDNIMLPDSNTNEPASHGSFTFSIKMLNNLPDFSQITNTAYIYFDYNAPVVTNTAFVTLDQHLSTKALPSVEMSVFPNPVTGDALMVSAAAAGTRFTVSDAIGRRLLNGRLDGPVDVSGLANGVYLMSLSGNNGSIGTVRFSVMRH